MAAAISINRERMVSPITQVLGKLNLSLPRFRPETPRESAVAISRGYSYRKATTGSTRMALRAGIQQAATEIAVSTIARPRKVAESVALMP